MPYNTGNAVPSKDPRDLVDNAENMDEAVNGTGDSWTDRLGNARPTLKRLEDDYPNAGVDADRAEAAAADAETAQTAAESAQSAAETAQDGAETAETNAAASASAASTSATDAQTYADAAASAVGIYDDTADGLAGTTEGDYFWVPSAVGDEGLILYRHDSGPAATIIKRNPSAVAVSNNNTGIAALDSRVTVLESRDIAPSSAELLLEGEQNGFAIDPTSDDVGRAFVVKKNGVVITESHILDAVAAEFEPTMVIMQDGSLGWSRHNNSVRTDDFEAAEWMSVNATITADQIASDRSQTAALLEATSNSASCYLRDGISTLGPGQHNSCSMIFRKGSADYAYIALNLGGYKYAHVNMNTGALGTVDAALEANVSTVLNDGTMLPAGYYRLEVSYTGTGTSTNFQFGPSDSDASTAVTAGASVYVEKPQSNYGIRAMDYMANPGASAIADVPYDWSTGSRMIALAGSTAFYSRYGDDLTETEWTKTDATAALDATGPHGEPCSTLTATANNGTCIQSVSNASNAQFFSAYVRRKTGTGPVEITSDGSAFTEITADINSDTFTRVSLAGTSNPDIGFRLGTSGDEIEVALAINNAKSYPGFPKPVHGSNLITNPCALEVDVASLFADADESTIYAAFATDGYPSQFATLEDASGDLAVDTNSNTVRFSADDGSDADDGPVDALTAGRYEITMRSANGKNAASTGGEPALCIPTVQAVTAETLTLGATGNTFEGGLFGKIVFTPRDVGSSEVAYWRYEGGAANGLVNSAVIGIDRMTPNVTMNREPMVTVLSDNGYEAQMLVFWMQKNVNGVSHPETPARIMQRGYVYNKLTNTLSPASDAAVAVQQPGWSSGDGHLQSPFTFVVPSGPYEGRIVMLMAYLVGDELAGNDRDLYVSINDAGGDPTQWTAPAVVATADSIGSRYIIPDPSNSIAILPPTHSVAPNRVVLMVDVQDGVRSLYSDTFGGADGTDWTIGALDEGPVGIDLTEPNIAYLPSGDILATSRTITDPSYDRRPYSISTDGGATFVNQGLLPSWFGSEVCAGIAQLDPTGVNGDQGRLVMSRAMDMRDKGGTFGRAGNRIDFATDGAFTFADPIYPLNTSRYYGYASIKTLFGGSHLALGVEGGTIPFNTDNTTYLCIVELPEA